jgi:type 1 glutamine amidotransferase
MIDYHARRNILLVTRGHPFEQEPFMQWLRCVPETVWTEVQHPAAPALFDPERAREFAAIVCYDMPGLDFKKGTQAGTGVDFVDPPAYLRRGMDALLEEGKPFIFLHHALAGWPAWPRYQDILGGRFHYKRDAGANILDSGYLHGVKHRVRAVADHPITAGVTEFEIEDELYLTDIDESGKIPLLRSGFDFDPQVFNSAHEAAVNDRLFTRHPWTRPRGSNLIAWLKKAGNSPIVYIQCGDGPAAYANPALRRILANTVAWITSPAAKDWARP